MPSASQRSHPSPWSIGVSPPRAAAMQGRHLRERAGVWCALLPPPSPRILYTCLTYPSHRICPPPIGPSSRSPSFSPPTPPLDLTCSPPSHSPLFLATHLPLPHAPPLHTLRTFTTYLELLTHDLVSYLQVYSSMSGCLITSLAPVPQTWLDEDAFNGAVGEAAVSGMGSKL